ncbi:MAG TPA: hypothetical protein PLT03_00890 [Bacillota bacterium]|nr:hypothetical protein [Bacillota bacterium]HOA15129.1 hypothetical protein [Bacillota bacterium]HOG52409.1 hypothetical protein [Bacillota bacterium]
MRIYRVMLIAAFMVLSLMQAGCMKTWTVDFTRTEDAELELVNWGGNTSWNMVEEPVKGVDVYIDHITTPVGFPADFILTLDMYLDISEDHPATFYIWIGEDDGSSPNNLIKCEFKYLGDSLNEELFIYEEGLNPGDITIGPIKPVPGLRYGNNRFKLDKAGSIIKISLNGDLIREIGTSVFDPDLVNFVSFLTDEYSNAHVVFRKISVKYDGELVDLY